MGWNNKNTIETNFTAHSFYVTQSMYQVKQMIHD